MSENVIFKDHFYVDLQKGEILWMSRNTDAAGGERLVSRRFGIELLREAVRECRTDPDCGPVYDYIEANCRRRQSAVGDPFYETDSALFKGQTVANVKCRSTMDMLELLFRAKELINEYCMEEFGTPADFENPERIGIAFTVTGDGEHIVQTCANLKKHRTEFYLDGELLAVQYSDNLKDYVEKQLTCLDFNELVEVPDWAMEEHFGRGIYRKGLEFMVHESWGKQYSLCLEVGKYTFGGGLAVDLYDHSEGELEPFSNLTVNLLDEQVSGPDCAFIDTNNFGTAEELIQEYRLGKPTGRIGTSGFCTYPEYRFDRREIRRYCLNPEDIPSMETGKKERSCER